MMEVAARSSCHRLIRGICLAAAPGQNGVQRSAVLSNGGGLESIPGDMSSGTRRPLERPLASIVTAQTPRGRRKGHGPMQKSRRLPVRCLDDKYSKLEALRCKRTQPLFAGRNDSHRRALPFWSCGEGRQQPLTGIDFGAWGVFSQHPLTWSLLEGDQPQR